MYHKEAPIFHFFQTERLDLDVITVFLKLVAWLPKKKNVNLHFHRTQNLTLKKNPWLTVALINTQKELATQLGMHIDNWKCK